MRAVIVACGVLGLASPALAGDMQQVEPGRFRCAPAPTQNFNEEVVPLKPGEELRIAFRLLKDYPGLEGAATASLLFHTADGDTAVSVGKAKYDRFEMFAAVFTPRTTQQLMFEYPITGKWIILKLNLDPRGYLTVRSNDLTQRFPVGSTKAVASHLNCHSGQWEIDVWPRSYVLAPH